MLARSSFNHLSAAPARVCDSEQRRVFKALLKECSLSAVHRSGPATPISPLAMALSRASVMGNSSHGAKLVFRLGVNVLTTRRLPSRRTVTRCEYL